MARILIVDDDELLAEAVVEALSRSGHMVSAVHHGDEALDAIRQSEPDLLILDLGLPGASGYQILRQVRQELDAATLPIMMLTGRHGRLPMARSHHEGADDYMTKPFDFDTLISRSEALLASGMMCQRVTRAAAGTN